MVDREETVIWTTNTDFLSNKPGNVRPSTQTVAVENDALNNTEQRKGLAVYVYDFGGTGEIASLDWSGEGFVSFRYKVADTPQALSQAQYVGSSNERFIGTVLDNTRWQAIPGPYIIVQNNQLDISGEANATNLFEQSGEIRSVTTTEFPAAAEVEMRLQKVANSTGAAVYIGITDGINSVLVQKFYQKIKAPAKVSTVNGQIVYSPNETNVGNTATVVVTRNGTLIFTEQPSKLTDGIFEKIDYTPIPTEQVDTLINLKRYADVTGLTDSPRPYGLATEAIPFRIRSDYNPNQMPEDFRQYVHYDVKKDVRFYRATIPMVHRRIDLYESQITSWNWNPSVKKWVLADTDNIWKLAITLPPGVHRYKFAAGKNEFYDVTNPLSYYLDANGQKVLITDGYGYGYGPDLTGKITFSELILESTQTIEFVFQGEATAVSLIGSFNDYDKTRHMMVEAVDRQLIRRLADTNFIYTNDNQDYHKVEIVLPHCTSIDTIDFVTRIPLGYKQRVKIFLDDLPVSKLDWNLIPVMDADEVIKRAGVGDPVPACMSYGYGFGDLVSGYGTYYGYGYGSGFGYAEGYSGIGYGQELICPLDDDATCDQIASTASPFSYWDNNTDTIAGAEDRIVRWCLKDGQVRKVNKITFLTRVEAGSPMRQHVALFFYGTSTQGLTVTDYGLSASYELQQKTHTTRGDKIRDWVLPIVPLNDGVNELTPVVHDADGDPVYGNPVTVTVGESRPAVWTINNSSWASGSLEILYGIPGQLSQKPTSVKSVVDDKTLNVSPTPQPTERFVDLNIRYQVDLMNVQVSPKIDLWAKLIGGTSTYVVRFYLTQAQAEADQDDLGEVAAYAYGPALPADFSGSDDPDGRANFFSLAPVTYKGKQEVLTVGNIIAIYERGGSDKIFAVRQVR